MVFGGSLYRLLCPTCGLRTIDDGSVTRCPAEHRPSLLRTEYDERSFRIDRSSEGMLRYRAWLPLREPIETPFGTVIIESAALNARLRTPNLRLAVNGFWPERGARLPSGTFKDIEAIAILGRFPRDGRTLVAASAGNTAVALASAASDVGVPTTIVVPESALERIAFARPLRENVRFIAVTGDAIYDDAIVAAQELGLRDGYAFEGGARNVARRDGIGTTMLAFMEVCGALPEYFVQAVGSGSGAIAAHEAARRAIASGQFPPRYPHLVLVQNAPFAPIFHAWNARSTSVEAAHRPDSAHRAGAEISAAVLGSLAPPYEPDGGLLDALTESAGDVTAVENSAARRASALFEELEGIDLEPAAAVALAGLIERIECGAIPRDASIALHITGVGRRRLAPERRITPKIAARIAADPSRR